MESVTDDRAKSRTGLRSERLSCGVLMAFRAHSGKDSVSIHTLFCLLDSKTLG